MNGTEGHLTAATQSFMHSSQDSVVMADVGKILSHIVSMQTKLPKIRLLCSPSALPNSASVFDCIMETGVNFVVDNLTDLTILQSMDIESSRSVVLNPYKTLSFTKKTMDIGVPIASADQLIKVSQVEAKNVIISVEINSLDHVDNMIDQFECLVLSCQSIGMTVNGIAFLSSVCLDNSEVSKIMQFFNKLVQITRRYDCCEISDIYFSASALESDNLLESISDSSFVNNYDIHVDATFAIMQNCYKLWARVKEKQSSMTALRGTHRYTVSEGLYTLFSNLLSVDDNSVSKPKVIACSGMERAIMRTMNKSKKLFHQSMICGPSGDISEDIVVPYCLLPDLVPGFDWIIIDFGFTIPSGLSSSEVMILAQ